MLSGEEWFSFLLAFLLGTPKRMIWWQVRKKPFLHSLGTLFPIEGLARAVV